MLNNFTISSIASFLFVSTSTTNRACKIGRTQTPLICFRENQGGSWMQKNQKINIRLTESEKMKIEEKSKMYNMTISKFIISSCLKDKIVIINGLDKIDTELRRIGNNINQLTRLANEKIITVVDLKELRMEVNNIWQLLKQLVQKQI